jgi:hypothetical protein
LKAFETLEARMSKLAKTDMMALAEATPAAATPLTETGFTLEALAKRGESARYVADNWAIPQSEWTPLSPSEVQNIKATLDSPDTTVDEELAIATALQELGPDMAAAAYRQLGKEDKAFAHAAKFLEATDDIATARDIMLGRRRLRSEPQPLGPGATGTVAADAFSTLTSQALRGVGNQDEVFEAARAHYAETRGRAGALTGGFSALAFQKSVRAVLGAQIVRINGADTLVPLEIDGDDFDDFLDNVVLPELYSMSLDGRPPVADPGTSIAREMRNAVLQAVGPGIYRVLIDGEPLLTDLEAGTPYIMRVNPEIVKQAAARD